MRSTPQGGVRGDAACRSSRFRRRTPERSGRRSSASAIPTGGCAAAAPGHSCTRSSTSRSSRSTCRAPETVGTALNALAHCGRGALCGGTQRRGRCRSAGGSAADRRVAAARRRATRATSRRAPGSCAAPVMRARPSASPSSRSATRWRRGSAAATASPHGALNALTLPLALRFNEPVAAAAIARFGAALGSDDPPARVEELARLGGFERLRDLGIPAEAPSRDRRGRGGASGAKANPRPVTPADVEQLLSSIW